MKKKRATRVLLTMFLGLVAVAVCRLWSPTDGPELPLSPDQVIQDNQPSREPSDCLKPEMSSSRVPLAESSASIMQTFSPPPAEDALESVRCWAETEPEAAASAISHWPDGPLRHAACEQVAIAWANHDSAAALAWSEALPEPEEQRLAVLAVAYEAARTDPAGATAAASVLPPSPERDEALAYAVRQWAGSDPTAAAGWAGQFEDSALRERLLAAICVGSAGHDPFASATFAASALAPGADQSRAVVAIVQRWARLSPSEAAAWVAQFPSGPARDDAQQELLMQANTQQ